jgi:ubiquitin-like 1-activating enzyme E1 B
MAGNIIPAIATTNAMTAGLCVLQAFKVMRDDLEKAKMVFLVRSTERIISVESLRPPKPECPVCSVTQSALIVDTARATLNDLVEDFLKLELGYGGEFSVSSEAGILYDPELDDNLPKKFGELGVKGDSFITVIDEEDENPRVNLVLAISEQSLPEDSKPIYLAEKLDIARKPKPTPPTETNGHAVVVTNGINGKRKRGATEADLEDDLVRKRGKVAEQSSVAAQNGDIIVLDDSTNGAILIDDE